MNLGPPTIFDRQQSAAKWSRARSRQARDGAASFLYTSLAEDLCERLDFMQMNPARVLLIGDAQTQVANRLNAGGSRIDVGKLGEFEEEAPGPSSTYDLIAHFMGLGMVNDLPGALIHARNALCEGGLFVAAFPGARSLPALRKIALAADGDRPAARMHPLVDNRAGTALLERALFNRQVVDSYTLKVRYSSLSQLIADLRDHGLTKSLSSPTPPLTREWWNRAQSGFDAMREEDGKVTETFEILTLTGWR